MLHRSSITSRRPILTSQPTEFDFRQRQPESHRNRRHVGDKEQHQERQREHRNEPTTQPTRAIFAAIAAGHAARRVRVVRSDDRTAPSRSQTGGPSCRAPSAPRRPAVEVYGTTRPACRSYRDLLPPLDLVSDEISEFLWRVGSGTAPISWSRLATVGSLRTATTFAFTHQECCAAFRAAQPTLATQPHRSPAPWPRAARG